MALEDLRAEFTPAELDAGLRALKGKLFVPHEGGQREVLDAVARFKIVTAGRRWGKTKAAAREMVRHAQVPNTMNWWVANSYKNVRRGYREVVRQIPRIMLAKEPPVATSNDLILYFKNGAIMEFYSGGNEDALAGEGLDFLVVDEGGLIPDSVWYQLLRPTLMDKMGAAFIISTPRGRNWFYELYKRGQSSDPEYLSWRFPQAMNPTVAASETESARLELPSLVYRQEILAEFLAAGASIFGVGVEREGTVMDMVVEPRGDVFMGIDLAKSEDFTVISASRADDRMPCFHQRFTDVSWPAQRQRIRDAVEYIEGCTGVENVTIMLDSTGVGDVVHDDLMNEGLYCIAQKFDNTWKDQAVSLLAADLEQDKAHILEAQREEFESYALTFTEAGRRKYEASSGHDDEVSAKLLEHWGMVMEGPPVIQTLEDSNERDLVDDILPVGEGMGTLDSFTQIASQPGAWH